MKSMALTHEEARTFKDKLDLYKESKRRILGKWTADCKALVTLEACKDGCPGNLLDVLPLAFSFLQEHGVINIGAVQQPRGHEAPAKSTPEEEPKQPSKAEIRKKLYAILRTADFEVMTEKKIRAQLESELGIDMTPYKAWVRKHVLHVLNNMDERDTLAPLPLTDDEDDTWSKGQQSRKGAREGSNTATLKQPPLHAKDASTRDVVVIGAGLAGLVAGNILQRNGVKVVVLEAQSHCGGRLAKLASGGEAAAQSPAASSTLGTGLAAAFGAVSLVLPVSDRSAVVSEGQASAGGCGGDGGWADAGSVVLTTLCQQLDISLMPLPLATLDIDGDGSIEAAAWQPRLYERCTAAEGLQSGVEKGPSSQTRMVARQVQDEAEGLLMELLQAVRHRVHRAATAGSSCQPPLQATLAEELRAALAQIVGPATQPRHTESRAAEASSEGHLSGAKPSAMEAAKVPSESEMTAPGQGANGAQGESNSGDVPRSVKRSRSEDAGAGRTLGNEDSKGTVKEEEGDGDGAANNRTGLPNDAREEGPGETAASYPDIAPQQTADKAADAVDAAEGASLAVMDGQGAGDQARRLSSEAAGGDQLSEAPPSSDKHSVRQEVLGVLHKHLLPLLELYFGAPLGAVAPDQLALLPHWLPGIGRPVGPPLTGNSTQPPPRLLPTRAVSKLVGALTAELPDIRTAVTVTSVTVTATGVKVVTEDAGTFTAAAAILAVPHGVLQAGSIRLDPAPLSCRTAAAARVSCGCAVTLRLVFPSGTDLGPLAAGPDKMATTPFLVSPALPRDVAGTAVAGADAGAASATTASAASHPHPLGFMFCPVTAEEAADSAASRGDGEVVLAAHLVGASAEQAASLSDEELQRHAMAALQAAATAAVGGGALPNAPAASVPGKPTRCHVTRWGGHASASSVAKTGSSRLAAAPRGAACAHLGPGAHLQDMQLLALPHKTRIFFAGEYTAPQHLRTGLLAAMAASGIREAARVLRALRNSATAPAAGNTTKVKAASAAAAAASCSLAVWDEQPHDELIAAAEAAATATAAEKGSAKHTGGKGSGSGSGVKRAAEAVVEAKEKMAGKKKSMNLSDGDEEGNESTAAASKRRKQADVDSAEQCGRKGKGKSDSASIDAKEKAKAKPASKTGKAGGGAKAEEEDEEASGSGGSGSEEEDEEEEDADEEEEVVGGRRKKAKLKRGSSSAQERKQKGKKPVKEKEGKRRRGSEGSDGDSQDEEEAGAGKAEAGKRAKGSRERERKEDPVQQGILDKQRRQQALAKLQADRKDLKVVYKAMMAAGNGNLAPLREHMATSGGVEAKQTMLQALQGASLPVLQRLAADGHVHTVLKDWLLDLCDEMSAEHLLLAELRLLERLPFSTDALTVALSPGAATGSAGAEVSPEEGGGDGVAGAGGGVPVDEGTPLRALVTAVRERCGLHRSKDVKRVSAHLVATWERRVSITGGIAATAGVTTITGAAVGAGGAIASSGPAGPTRSNPAKFDPRTLVSLRKATLAPAPTAVASARVTPPPAAARHTQSQGSGDAAAGAGSTAAAEPTSGVLVAQEAAAASLDPALEARLMAAKAAAEAARQEAALAAQRRAEVLQEAQAGVNKRVASLPEIATFEDFKRFERVAGGGTGSGDGASGKHHRESGTNSARQHKGSSGSGSGSATGGAGGGSAELEALKSEVLEFTKQLLRHHHKAGKITTAGYRLILDKASRKVFETLTHSSSGSHGGSKGDLLGSKRREKIRKLVDQYVQKMGSQEGGAAVGGGPSGIGSGRSGAGPGGGSGRAVTQDGFGGVAIDTGGETLLPPPPPPPPPAMTLPPPPPPYFPPPPPGLA